MVTHNPELAEQYSTRIIRLLDGAVIDDTMPYDGEDIQEQSAVEETQEDEAKTNKGKKKKDLYVHRYGYVAVA